MVHSDAYDHSKENVYDHYDLQASNNSQQPQYDSVTYDPSAVYNPIYDPQGYDTSGEYYAVYDPKAEQQTDYAQSQYYDPSSQDWNASGYTEEEQAAY